VLLAQQGLRPGLCLTVDAQGYPELCDWIGQRKAAFGLNITNLGEVSKSAITKLYAESNALIFPSLLESFGLPLIEARQVGLPILAAELDYVRDLIDPEETFDPNSARSMARAVRRFLGLPHPDTTILDAATFVAMIVERGRHPCTS
jgi:glycosyltransferase involved in cell wall biosynthesis